MSGFYLGESSNSASPNSSTSDLPYPVPLPRSDFLSENFSPSIYLSTLHNRHQTLEDLQAELRSRSQLLNQELLDLVNSNYQDFLGLGGSLKGGEEKVEEVRVGLLGFRKEVTVLRKAAKVREGEVKQLLDERQDMRRKTQLGRRLLEFHERLEELEEKLMLGSTDTIPDIGDEDDFDESDDGSDEDGENRFLSSSRIRRHAREYLYIKEIATQIGLRHPFLVLQEARMLKVRNTLLLDLGTALKQAIAAGASGRTKILSIIGLYAELDEAGEALRNLQTIANV